MKNAKGFTLMEVVVVLGIIALLTAIMTPIVLDYLEDAKRSQAQAECNSIYAALLKFNKDNKKWPGTEATMFLYSDGAVPTDSGGTTVGGYEGDGLAFADDSIKLYPDYLEANPKDAWGNAYVVLVGGLFGVETTEGSTDSALILSAGPDGELNTDYADKNPQGDDIGRRIK